MAYDLTSGFLVISALSVLAFVAGRQIRAPRATQWFFLAVLGSLLFAWTFSGNLRWATVVPSPAVVFLSNLMPVMLGFAAGLASEAKSLTRVSRPLAIFSFVALASTYALVPYTRPVFYPVKLAAETQWRGDVCLQSHSSTCAPAAAVMLLNLEGVQTSEQRMVNACLTSTRGTEPLGLFRGLALATRRTKHTVRVATSSPQLWEDRGQLPNISLVWLDAGCQNGSSQWLLGPRGEGHAIVVLGRDSDRNWIIADPAFGKTKWTDEQFRSRFTGDALYVDTK